MKDFRGTEIRVGDTIVCGERPGSSGCYLVSRKVVAIEPDRVQVVMDSEKWDGSDFKPVLRLAWRRISRNICVVQEL